MTGVRRALIDVTNTLVTEHYNVLNSCYLVTVPAHQCVISCKLLYLDVPHNHLMFQYNHGVLDQTHSVRRMTDYSDELSGLPSLKPYRNIFDTNETVRQAAAPTNG